MSKFSNNAVKHLVIPLFWKLQKSSLDHCVSNEILFESLIRVLE